MNHGAAGHAVHDHGGHPNEPVRDPVCGMNVDPKSTAHKYSCAGQPYVFCSQDCVARFRREPKRYVDRNRRLRVKHGPLLRQWLNTASRGPTARTRSVPDASGDHTHRARELAPICGMALEPKTISAGDEPNPELADMQRRFWVSLVLTIPVVIVAIGEMIPGQPLRQLASQLTWTWVELILSSPVILWGGCPSSSAARNRL